MSIQNRSTEAFDRAQPRAHDRSPKSKIEDGFTLVELTIGVTLLALMVTVLYGAFFVGHRAVDKARARSEESQWLRSVEDLLGGYIRAAYPYRASPREQEIFFSGKERQLTFVSAFSSGLGGRGMSKVSVSWDPAEGLLTLEEQIPLRLESPGEATFYANRLPLARGVSHFRLEYLEPEGAEERWVEEWDGRQRRALPRAARLHLRGDRGGEVRWVFPIMIRVLAP